MFYMFFTPRLINRTALAVFALLAAVPAVVSARELPELNCPPSGAGKIGIAHDLVGSSPAAAGGVVNYRAANGLNVALHTSEGLKASLTYYNGGPVIPLSGGRYLTVITDINDPAIYNKGDGEFHPFPEELVISAIEEIGHPNMDFDVDVYILPYPRSNVLVSSASGKEVFLSPHVLEIHPAVASYIVAHEIGHVFQNVYMPVESSRWNRYKQIRRITDEARFSDTGAHSYRPAEIFAEDFRVLCGGALAAFGGRIENPELPSPLLVAGLEDFMRTTGGVPVAVGPKVRASNYPNPFNPETEIHVTVPAEMVAERDRVSVRIYDVRGALVRELYSGVPDGEQLQMRWDGRDGRGNHVASSNYFAVVEAGLSRTVLKLVLIK